ncbi:hypothetical protein OAB57_03205 [Bacteriovoracaceae bacterium]|nr:hypothetical protein [Bacteriovoracaceae bacterium]
MTKPLFIYLFSFIMLTSINYHNGRQITRNYTPQRTPDWVKNKKKLLRENIADRKLVQVALSIILGQKRGLQKKLIKQHKIIGSMHLFTPSGIHMGSAFLIFHLLVMILPRRYRSLALKSVILSSCLILLIQQFTPSSIKRLSLLRLIVPFVKDIEYFYLFLITFAIDATFGTMEQSPASYTLSFMFLGILLAHKSMPPVTIPFLLFGGQLIMHSVWDTPFYLFSPMTNFIITAIFGYLFPVILIAFTFNYYFILEKSLSFFCSLSGLMADITIRSPSISPAISLILLIFILSSNLSSRVKKNAFFMIILLHSNFLVNRTPDFQKNKKRIFFAKRLTSEKLIRQLSY